VSPFGGVSRTGTSPRGHGGSAGIMPRRAAQREDISTRLPRNDRASASEGLPVRAAGRQCPDRLRHLGNKPADHCHGLGPPRAALSAGRRSLLIRARPGRQLRRTALRPKRSGPGRRPAPTPHTRSGAVRRRHGEFAPRLEPLEGTHPMSREPAPPVHLTPCGRAHRERGHTPREALGATTSSLLSADRNFTLPLPDLSAESPKRARFPGPGDGGLRPTHPPHLRLNAGSGASAGRMRP
jgi:hypothetical protein